MSHELFDLDEVVAGTKNRPAVHVAGHRGEQSPTGNLCSDRLERGEALDFDKSGMNPKDKPLTDEVKVQAHGAAKIDHALAIRGNDFGQERPYRFLVKAGSRIKTQIGRTHLAIIPRSATAR